MTLYEMPERKLRDSIIRNHLPIAKDWDLHLWLGIDPNTDVFNIEWHKEESFSDWWENLSVEDARNCRYRVAVIEDSDTVVEIPAIWFVVWPNGKLTAHYVP